MSVGNPRIELAVRNPECEDCKLHQQANGKNRCVTARGWHNADVLVVTKTPLAERGRKELHTYLTRAGFDVDRMAFTAALKCLSWDMSATRTDVKTCRKYLDAEIAFIKPKWIIAIGNEALLSTTGRSGITKYRGITHQRKDGVQVVATISPAMVYRNPGLKGGFEADLSYMYRLTSGQAMHQHEPHDDQYHEVMTKADLKAMVKALQQADEIAFDIESTGFDEFAPDARIVSLAVTCRRTIDGTLETRSDVYALPLYHPQSPWRRVWRRVLRILAPFLIAVKKRDAHNGKFDCRWLHQFGVEIYQTFDTMLAAHLLDENRPKGLKPLARQLLGVPPWAIDTADLLDTPIHEVLRYNALDTWHTLGLVDVLRPELLANKRLTNIMRYMLIPASNTMVRVERHGVWTDREQLQTNWHIAQSELDTINAKLMEWVPDDHGFAEVNFNPSNFARWWLFEYLEFPILARGKEKDDGSPGDPSMAEDVMTTLREMFLMANDHARLTIVEALLERSKWVKYNNAFFSAYAEQLDDNDRIHTTFKLTGTVTGRLSSGKPDQEKVTGKKQNRGVNMQQVPRDVFVRGVFGAPEGYTFVQADYSQIELRVAAFLAQEPTMLHLYATGQDVHMTMAMRMTGKPASRVTKEERKKAKAVNFGFLYGMGWRKFIMTAWANYGVRVTPEEAQAFRKAFFDQFPLLLPWHARQRLLVSKYERVESPIGRVRHLPDITSKNADVRAEAERQAINSPVQGFASDMALLGMVLLDNKFRKMGLETTPIGAVHDAINFEAPDHELPIVLPMIKNTMENLPLERLFNVDLNIPIVADLAVGDHWGGAIELTPEQVFDFPGKELIGA